MSTKQERIKTMRAISNQDNVIDSRDVIERIEELEAELQTLQDEVEEIEDNLGGIDCDDDPEAYSRTEESLEDAKEAVEDWKNSEEAEELAVLKSLAEEASDSPDWKYGETLINDDYFTEYIKELIDDCYEMPKEINSGRWPYNHITVDYESAAEEAKQDYLSVDYDGATFWIKA